jgi:hypothetical protein
MTSRESKRRTTNDKRRLLPDLDSALSSSFDTSRSLSLSLFLSQLPHLHTTIVDGITLFAKSPLPLSLFVSQLFHLHTIIVGKLSSQTDTRLSFTPLSFFISIR